MDDRDQQAEAGSHVPSVGQTVWNLTVSGARFWFKWTLGGAVLGGVGLAGAGLYYFGLQGMIWGAGVGAVIGALVALGVLIVASAESSLF
jgi:hypothetical protein